MKVTLKQTGYTIQGESVVNAWGGGQGIMQMDENFIPLDSLTVNALLGCVNDGRFGVESIESADLDVYMQYENGYKEFDRTIHLSKSMCIKHQDKFHNGI